MGRRHPRPSSTSSHEPSMERQRRHVSIHQVEKNADFCSNHVRTYKYTPSTFLPLFLLESFRKAANFYFLAVSVMQCVHTISNTNGLPTTLPTLLFILFIDGAFAVAEDRKRHQADAVANSRLTHVLSAAPHTDFVLRPWADLRVGHFVQLFNRDVVPADLLLLSVQSTESGGSGGMAFVETKSLDGETNMKVRQAVECTANVCHSPMDLRMLRGHIVMELPNNQIHTFKGVLHLEAPALKQESIPVESILLRGVTLRNTESIFGLVLSTGHDTKIMRSNKTSTTKVSRLDACINQYIGALVLLLVVCCTMAATGNLLWLYYHATHAPYLALPPPSNPIVTWLESFFYYILLMYQFVPISLYVSMASVKYLQSLFIKWDVQMYHAPSDTPAIVRCMALNEELGQVSHLFSDKTGTLTCNMMEFRKCSIGGVSYGTGVPEGSMKSSGNAKKRTGLSREDSKRGTAALASHPANSSTPTKPPTPYVNFEGPELREHMQGVAGDDQAKRIHLFFSLLAVCHTVLPERPLNHQSESTPPLTYSAASPDEQALVCAAAYFGFTFLERQQKQVVVDVHGSRVTYDLLAVLEFNSTRKRMSTIVRDVATNTIYLFTKGADGIVVPRTAAHMSAADLKLHDMTLAHLSAYAREGFRTLTVAYKELPRRTYATWAVKYAHATGNLDEVEKYKSGFTPNDIDDCMDEIESELHLLGATAIEDKLQDGVPDAIATLIEAGIKIWMLTGDKDETAVNIAYASNLLQVTMRCITVTSKKCTTAEATQRELMNSLATTMHAPASDGSAKSPPRPLQLSRQQSLLRRAQSLRSQTKSRVTLSQSRISLHNRTADPLALVIDGDCVHHALKLCPETFVSLAQKCKVVLACRVSPAQKAALVALVKTHVPSSRTLSIGDGANDVPMIQEAHIGVGISGQEGLQAVNASDYALAQFAYLKRLLLVHGRYNYERIAKLVLYIIYKNILLIMAQFVFSTYAGLSGQKIFLEAGIQLYNVALTSLPIIALAVADKDVRDDVVLRLPSLYRAGPLNMHLNHGLFVYWVGCAIVEAITITLAVVAAADRCGIHGESPTLWFLGNVVLTLVVVVANAKLVFVHHRFFAFTPLFLVGSILVWVVTAVVSSNVYMISGIAWTDMIGNTFAHHVVWVAIPFVAVQVLVYSYVMRAITVTFFPTPADIVKEFVYVSQQGAPSRKGSVKISVPRPSKVAPQDNSTGKDNSAAAAPRGSLKDPNTRAMLSTIPQGGSTSLRSFVEQRNEEPILDEE
ncbi:Aste57867_21046 [Aphanomyces stellatus]|uniref:Phospholipid-transporting ATPase n=1 Tax=Aphanomyces stellatus TaxID=120398 RepID=A0A485LH43_9STRA|nr:hypothetical protein As57867_020978 [Aphanomyces stellatus]VFT97721.1 Aste57867_21046 [Aphanomyces stellatus]